MKIRIFLLGTLLLTALSSVACSDEAEISLENLCKISGGEWKDPNCICGQSTCETGIVCVNNKKLNCANKTEPASSP